MVPSPRPRSWVEADAFRVLIRNKLLHSVVPVLMGGGGGTRDSAGQRKT